MTPWLSQNPYIYIYILMTPDLLSFSLRLSLSCLSLVAKATLAAPARYAVWRASLPTNFNARSGSWAFSPGFWGAWPQGPPRQTAEANADVAQSSA